MARRRKSNLESMASLPWPVGVMTGLIMYWVIRHGIGFYFSSTGGPMLAGVGQQLGSGVLAPLAWVALIGCWAAALASYVGRRKRAALLDSQQALESVASVGWREFEMLVGEAFRRQGYLVEETGLGGADGGIDLVLCKDGRKELVQCKHWRTRQVSVATVREMWGLAMHHGADGVQIVCSGTFTPDAAGFAEGKPIKLIGGEEFLGMIRAVQNSAVRPAPSERIPPTAAPSAPAAPEGCPRCGKPMVRRNNRSTNSVFLGCSSYPACKGTRAATA